MISLILFALAFIRNLVDACRVLRLLSSPKYTRDQSIWKRIIGNLATGNALLIRNDVPYRLETQSDKVWNNSLYVGIDAHAGLRCHCCKNQPVQYISISSDDKDTFVSSYS